MVKDLDDKTFGLLTVKEIVAKSRNGNLWCCECACRVRGAFLYSICKKSYMKLWLYWCGCLGACLQIETVLYPFLCKRIRTDNILDHGKLIIYMWLILLRWNTFHEVFFFKLENEERHLA